MTRTASRIDVRTIAPHERHPLIFGTFGQLAPGEAPELVNDHAITRTAPGGAAGSCCGGCGRA